MGILDLSLFKNENNYVTEISPVDNNHIIPGTISNSYHSWVYEGINVLWLPELSLEDTSRFMNIHKMVKSCNGFKHNKECYYINGDEEGVIGNALLMGEHQNSCYENYILEKNKDVFVKNGYVDFKESQRKVYINMSSFELQDIVDKQIEGYDAYSVITYRLTKPDIFMIDHILKTLSYANELKEYMTTHSIISCGEFFLINFEKKIF